MIATLHITCKCSHTVDGWRYYSTVYIVCNSIFLASQEELNEVASAWNDHRIRPVHNSRSPHGRPSIMHAVPQLYGARDYLHPISLENVEACLEDCVFKDFPCDEDVFNICVDLISEHNLEVTNEVFATVDLYMRLRQLIHNELQLGP